MARHHRPYTRRRQLNRHGRKKMRLHYRHQQRKHAPGSFHFKLCGFLARAMWARKLDEDKEA